MKLTTRVKAPRYLVIEGCLWDGTFADDVSKALALGAALAGNPLVNTDSEYDEDHPTHPDESVSYQAVVFPTAQSAAEYHRYSAAVSRERAERHERALAAQLRAELRAEEAEAKRVARDLAKRAAENRKLAAAEAAELKEKWNLGAFLP